MQTKQSGLNKRCLSLIASYLTKSAITKLVFLSIFIPFMLPNANAADASKTLNKAPMVAISNGWIRATHPGQAVGAGYLTLTSAQDATLTSVTSTLTPSVEIHSMTMKNGVMKMRMLETLALPANKPISLAPGGYHLMFFDLKQPLAVGEKVTLNLSFTNAKSEKSTQTVVLDVKEAAEDDAHAHH